MMVKMEGSDFSIRMDFDGFNICTNGERVAKAKIVSSELKTMSYGCFFYKCSKLNEKNGNNNFSIEYLTQCDFRFATEHALKTLLQTHRNPQPNWNAFWAIGSVASFSHL